MTERNPKHVEIRPGVGVLALLSSMNYKPWYALAELVDNALASFLSNRKALKKVSPHQDHVTVRIRFDRGAGTIEVTDDAAGIAGKDVARAFRPAEPPPDVTGLAQFGIGMKSAACWYSDTFEVTSTAVGEKVRRSVSFDVPKIVKQQIDELQIGSSPAKADEHGTTITLSNLHRPIPSGRTLGKIRSYLGSIYREFLRDDTLILEVGEENIEYDEPEILKAPRWDAKNGRSKTWKKDLEVQLASGRRVSGWAALRARGSTSQAGLALLFRRKVVVGAGAQAGDIEDLFRPAEIFGASTSFVSQRLYGELDVSEMQVAHSKDAILWDGEEDEFLALLRKQLDAGAMPLLKMAQGHRVTEKGPTIEKELARAVESTVEAAAKSTTFDGGLDDDNAGQQTSEEIASTPFRVPTPTSDLNVVLSVVVGNGRSWIRIADSDPKTYRIEIDRQHPFMQAFAHLPGKEIEPVLRLAAALGLAEIEARQAGSKEAGAVRARLNQLLAGPLARSEIGEGVSNGG